MTQADAAAAYAALAHPHGLLGDREAGAMQEQDDFRLRIILGIPVRERFDYLAIRGAESAGAVSDPQSREHSNQP